MKHMAMIRFFTFIFVLILVASSAWLWFRDGISAVDPNTTTPIAFEIRQGESVRSIVSRLRQQNLIRSSTAFYLLIKFTNMERSFQAGQFRLTKAMDGSRMSQELTHGITDVWITTLEGWRIEEIASILAKELNIPETEFLKYAQEGYMFPDTYQLPKDASASAVASIFRETFTKKVTDAMRVDSKKIGLTFDQIITLASIVEREGRSNTDRPVIAGILLKRFREDWPLQADATLQYALGYQGKEKTWWKKELLDEDKKVLSLFNTYLHVGLPPAPISNPGLESIQAVIYAKESPYWYYIHDPKGEAHYGKTIEEHEANVSTYLRSP